MVAYLEDYPLFYSKFLNYKNWAVHSLVRSKQYKTESGSQEIKALKANHNNNRTAWTWDHLDKFYIN